VGLLIRAAGHDGRAAEHLMLALAGVTSGLGGYFGSHPPLQERITAVRRILQQQG
jgi:Zn-dependent protease with chaperone function